MQIKTWIGLEDRPREKYVDVQFETKLQYGEGIEALLEKMRPHGLIGVSSWHIFDATKFLK